MTAPVEVSGSDFEAHPEVVVKGMGKAIQGRSLWEIAWLRLRRDKVAVGGAFAIVALVVASIVGPWFLPDPNVFNQDMIDTSMLRPKEGWLHSGMSWDHLLGVEPTTGRDLLARILIGTRVSLLVSIAATLLSVAIGVVMGGFAGYFGGWVDTVVSRFMDALLAFPLLLFAIALIGILPRQMWGLEGNGLKITVLVFIIGFFYCPYVGRIVRGQTLSLREREFVDAARALGASHTHIFFKEVLPNLFAPIIVYATLLIPTNILFEASLSFLGVGVNAPLPSLGLMLNEAVALNAYENAPLYMVFPGLTIFLAVLAFNLLGDGLRDALDPRSR
ncbi:peptide/nickel transport system permease protein/oligopeptide transport system permease protein [Actinocorallia herbida]|uniref:Peptide/nickel transport system permease protein/oligopeptide transport system permease protein n=1 Tax=Actinocorallia herbida TaxID=58109 RepID=A0A3N1D4J6_9ACTN|nr:ABC transporter permease [Actinocorallia herbida]ROO88454.1 peptide/nickel transport system permease protein/oligopeptide transport system permease protein [Actinocorallia herbida]